MRQKPIKIAIAGTHSTGKSTFLAAVQAALIEKKLVVVLINDLAVRARGLGFPILTEHTYESTLWIMAECLRQEAEASLSADVILVDRPPFDALGYFEAALEVSGRNVDPKRLEELRTIAQAHAEDYDLTIVTSLDPSIPLGEGRDSNQEFRMVAARHIAALASTVPRVLKMNPDNSEEISRTAIGLATKRG